MKAKCIQFSNSGQSENEDVLECPACGGFNLHHVRIAAFERAEDSETGIHVEVASENVTVDQNLSGNPSGRRHGLVIKFDCEGCSADIEMHIYQHKGSTFLGMNYTDSQNS